MLNTVEKIEKILFKAGKFSIKNVILLGSKNSVTGVRIDPIHSRSYNSSKYVGIANLNQISIDTNDYITFSYSDYNEKIYEEVYVSYPHMLSIINFFEQILDLVYQENFYTNNSVNPAFFDKDGNAPMIISEPLGGGKYIDFYPSMLQDKDNNFLPGGLLTVNNNESAFVELDIRSIESIHYILSNINLGEYSNQTLIVAMLNELSGFNNNSHSNNGFSQQQSSFGRTTMGTRSNMNNNMRTSNRRGITANRGNNSLGGSLNQSVTNNNQKSSNNDLTENEESQIPNPTNKRGGKSISMSDILNTADEIEVPLDEVEI